MSERVVSGPAASGRPLFGRPFVWLVFAVALAVIPLIGFAWRAAMTWDEFHPALNAVLNGTAAVFLIAGWRAIAGRHVAFHRKCMVSAFTMSTLFLASYLARFYLSGSHKYPGDGWDKIVYLVILMSHMVLAAAVVPLALRTLYLAVRKRYPQHRRIARWTLPIWIYVSVTGVVVYVMLYPIAGAG